MKKKSITIYNIDFIRFLTRVGSLQSVLYRFIFHRSNLSFINCFFYSTRPYKCCTVITSFILYIFTHVRYKKPTEIWHDSYTCIWYFTAVFPIETYKNDFFHLNDFNEYTSTVYGTGQVPIWLRKISQMSFWFQKYNSNYTELIFHNIQLERQMELLHLNGFRGLITSFQIHVLCCWCDLTSTTVWIPIGSSFI